MAIKINGEPMIFVGLLMAGAKDDGDADLLTGAEYNIRMPSAKRKTYLSFFIKNAMIGVTFGYRKLTVRVRNKKRKE